MRLEAQSRAGKHPQFGFKLVNDCSISALSKGREAVEAAQCHFLSQPGSVAKPFAREVTNVENRTKNKIKKGIGTHRAGFLS